MKTLIITGASKGIGLATAKMFLEQGYQVINLSRSAPQDSRITHITANLSNAAGISAACDSLGATITSGEITLVHNAAKLVNDTAIDAEPDVLRELLELNVVAAHTLNRVVFPLMRPGSSIIYIGSTLSEKAVANTFSYVTSKHAVIGMMKATCQDLQGRGIHTSCVCPGFTDTEMLREHVGEDSEVLNSIAGLSTFGR